MIKVLPIISLFLGNKILNMKAPRKHKEHKRRQR